MTWRRTIGSTSLAIGIVSLAIVFSSFYADVQNTSPGDVARVHAHLVTGANKQNCALCHGTNSKTMTESCLDCHQDIAGQLEIQTGFHGLMDAKLSTDCGKCHSDHHGADFQVTNVRSFQLAGIDDPSEYDHAGLDLQLTGKHLAIGCDKCHADAKTTLLTKGTKRFIGLDQNCTSCHEDVHKQAYGQNCDSCHGQEHPFARAANFKHTTAFSLVGAHGKAACIDCHQKDTKHAVDTLLASAYANETPEATSRSCRDCHRSPHKETFLANVSHVLNLSVDASCEHCHDSVHDTFLGPAATIDVQLHTLTGFPLRAPHNKASCDSCHEDYGRQKTRFVSLTDPAPIRIADDCQVCHKDPHGDQFKNGPFQGQGCLSCHERHTFHPPAFGVAEHSQTDFSLRGAHRLLECNQCHKLSPDATTLSKGKSVPIRVFHGTPDSCRACHEDLHRGQFSVQEFRDADWQLLS